MEYKKILSITGLGGLWLALSQRNDGLIAKSLDSGKTQFIPSRLHQFTFLESITIYMSNNDSKELKEVFLNIKKNAIPLIDANKASKDELRAFFTTCEPDHDTEMVHISDIKKIIKWYQTLTDHKLLEETSATAVEAPVAEEAPKKKKEPKEKKVETEEDAAIAEEGKKPVAKKAAPKKKATTETPDGEEPKPVKKARKKAE